MNTNILTRLLLCTIFVAMATLSLTACGQANTDDTSLSNQTLSQAVSSLAPADSTVTSQAPSSVAPILQAADKLYVRFGDNGEPFTMQLYDNATAAAIARHVGTADWRIPLYTYDGYDNWEIMQYYDIPSRYEIPSSAERITSQAAGTVYYSDPNRIVLFYGEGEVSGDYTPVGYFDVTPEFVSAVESNPVLEGWSNKIIKISAEE